MTTQIKQGIRLDAVCMAARAAVARSFGEQVSGARLFNEPLGVCGFNSFENPVVLSEF